MEERFHIVLLLSESTLVIQDSRRDETLLQLIQHYSNDGHTKPHTLQPAHPRRFFRRFRVRCMRMDVLVIPPEMRLDPDDDRIHEKWPALRVIEQEAFHYLEVHDQLPDHDHPFGRIDGVGEGGYDRNQFDSREHLRELRED